MTLGAELLSQRMIRDLLVPFHDPDFYQRVMKWNKWVTDDSWSCLEVFDVSRPSSFLAVFGVIIARTLMTSVTVRLRV